MCFYPTMRSSTRILYKNFETDVQRQTFDEHVFNQVCDGFQRLFHLLSAYFSFETSVNSLVLQDFMLFVIPTHLTPVWCYTLKQFGNFLRLIESLRVHGVIFRVSCTFYYSQIIPHSASTEIICPGFLCFRVLIWIPLTPF